MRALRYRGERRALPGLPGADTPNAGQGGPAPIPNCERLLAEVA